MLYLLFGLAGALAALGFLGTLWRRRREERQQHERSLRAACVRVRLGMEAEALTRPPQRALDRRRAWTGEPISWGADPWRQMAS